jgi:hypothetical protein
MRNSDGAWDGGQLGDSGTAGRGCTREVRLVYFIVGAPLLEIMGYQDFSKVSLQIQVLPAPSHLCTLSVSMYLTRRNPDSCATSTASRNKSIIYPLFQAYR